MGTAATGGRAEGERGAEEGAGWAWGRSLGGAWGGACGTDEGGAWGRDQGGAGAGEPGKVGEHGPPSPLAKSRDAHQVVTPELNTLVVALLVHTLFLPSLPSHPPTPVTPPPPSSPRYAHHVVTTRGCTAGGAPPSSPPLLLFLPTLPQLCPPGGLVSPELNVCVAAPLSLPLARCIAYVLPPTHFPSPPAQPLLAVCLSPPRHAHQVVTPELNTPLATKAADPYPLPSRHLPPIVPFRPSVVTPELNTLVAALLTELPPLPSCALSFALFPPHQPPQVRPPGGHLKPPSRQALAFLSLPLQSRQGTNLLPPGPHPASVESSAVLGDGRAKSHYVGRGSDSEGAAEGRLWAHLTLNLQSVFLNAATCSILTPQSTPPVPPHPLPHATIHQVALLTLPSHASCGFDAALASILSDGASCSIPVLVALSRRRLAKVSAGEDGLLVLSGSLRCGMREVQAELGCWF
ncbi:unnamed protein product [Closterium sp. Naga37s-1]|nr:unnamed protein product [Closterium sp. Naga37s-1]